MGGRGGSSGAGGKGGGGLGADIRRVYGRLVGNYPGGYVPIADIRDVLPNVGREQLTDALKNLARTDPRFQLTRWDDQKVLTDRLRSAGFTFGAAHVHVIHINKS